MTIGRVIIKYIDIHDTNNGHIEIDDRMKPMHDYPDNKNTLNLMIGVGGGIYIKVMRTRVYQKVGAEDILYEHILYCRSRKYNNPRYLVVFDKKNIVEKNDIAL